MIELTSRLTLSSCVSQLTNFYSTDIMPAIIDNGMQEVLLNLCDLSGELYPYTIQLTPKGDNVWMFQPDRLVASVMVSGEITKDHLDAIPFFVTIEKQNMRTQDLYKCALHVCGDYIKFAQTH